LIGGSNGKLVFNDPAGGMFVFYDYADDIPERMRGRLCRMYNQAGVCIQSEYDMATGRVSRRTRQAANGEIEAFVYGYTSAGLLSSVERRRVTGGAEVVSQSVSYGYYGGAVGENGDADALRRVVVYDQQRGVVRRFHYRYYRAGESAGGGLHSLKLAIGPRNYERLLAAGQDPETMATSLLVGSGAYANRVDKYFEYDSSGRVTKQALRTADEDGSGTYQYAYAPRSAPPTTPGPNDWLMKTVETQPDGSQNVVYTNKNGDVLLKAAKASASATSQWVNAYRYDANWRLTWHVTPAAMQPVSGAWYAEVHTDLLDFSGGNSPYVNDVAGQINRWEYYGSTDPQVGAVEGYLYRELMQVGEMGTPTIKRVLTHVGHNSK
jgi:hypothetical protein